MLVPIEWLGDYINLENIDIEEYCERMIMSGSNLETCEYFGKDIENVVVGKIVSLEKHPQADKLTICKIDIGGERLLQIVTGAKNLEIGAFYPVALDGARVPGPLHGKPKEEGGTIIKSGELRGILSEGMLCSCEELGFNDSIVPVNAKEGLWMLEGEFTPGQNIVEALGIASCSVDFEITPNRPDCLSMIGMARETAATFERALNYPDTNCEELGEGVASDYIDVEIKRPDLCKRYIARIITDVKIQQSPWWLQKRLMYAGMRPINNIVDITNFVMLEYGQPLHAFDINTVAQRKIVVDTASNGEKFTTLDNKERELDDTILMIKDAEKSIGIAGIMGGLNSEIEDDTNTVILESANFFCDGIRASSKKLGKRSEASSRYEKGIDPNLCKAAADRFCKLVEMIGAGKVVKGCVDIYPEVEEPQKYPVRVSRMNSVIGIDLTKEEIVKLLNKLEIQVENSEDEDVMLVIPPTVRQDLKIEIDFAEEISRIYGYDKLPNTLPKMNVNAELPESWNNREIARTCMSALGANEIQTYSFVSPKSVEKIRVPEGSWEYNILKLLNPLGEDTSAMRTVLLPNMLEVLGRNYSKNVADVKAYEIGNVFRASIENKEHVLPKESLSMAIGIYGKNESFFTLKGILEELFETFGVKGVEYIAESNYGTYHPGRCAKLMKDGKQLGIMGELHPEVADTFGIGARCYTAEISFTMLEEMADMQKLYKQLPKFPAMVRDIALVVDENVTVGEIEKSMWDANVDLLESIALFDVYRGAQVGESKKSLAFSLTYRSLEKTLTDEEVQIEHSKILSILSERFNAALREM